jgi:hypothetical protein
MCNENWDNGLIEIIFNHNGHEVHDGRTLNVLHSWKESPYYPLINAPTSCIDI